MTAITMEGCLTVSGLGGWMHETRRRTERLYLEDVKRVPAILEDPEQRASLEERIAAARELGESDPRAGVFVRIEQGSFLRGTNPPDGEPGEQPQVLVHTA